LPARLCGQSSRVSRAKAPQPPAPGLQACCCQSPRAPGKGARRLISVVAVVGTRFASGLRGKHRASGLYPSPRMCRLSGRSWSNWSRANGMPSLVCAHVSKSRASCAAGRRHLGSELAKGLAMRCPLFDADGRSSGSFRPTSRPSIRWIISCSGLSIISRMRTVSAFGCSMRSSDKVGGPGLRAARHRGPGQPPKEAIVQQTGKHVAAGIRGPRSYEFAKGGGDRNRRPALPMPAVRGRVVPYVRPALAHRSRSCLESLTSRHGLQRGALRICLSARPRITFRSGHAGR